MNLKSIKIRDNIESRREDKTLNLDDKQMHVLQRRIIEMRLQQERKDFQKYLRELKNLKLKSSSTQIPKERFSPLEFPKIAEFTSGNVEAKIHKFLQRNDFVSLYFIYRQMA
jgi:TPP-dependent 2-oxoacid decarboxylase